MTLKQLEAFYWAASCATFAMAAERVHLSVSSLSKRIAELEASLGQVLFDRAGHRAALTEAGTRLLPLPTRGGRTDGNYLAASLGRGPGSGAPGAGRVWACGCGRCPCGAAGQG